MRVIKTSWIAPRRDHKPIPVRQPSLWKTGNFQVGGVAETSALLRVLNFVRGFGPFVCAFLALTAGSAPAWAFDTSQPNAPLTTLNQMDQQYADNQPQPYAMRYSDEAAAKLGVQDGKWEAFDTHSSDPLVPSLKGGIDHGGAMLSLQWRPGQ
jgi:hypothetical protein